MSIYARRLQVEDYRSYTSYELALCPDVTVLVGPNAAGKTNLVEALQLLTAASSFRKPAPHQLVRQGATAARLALTLEGEGRLLEMGLVAQAGKRAFSRNGKRARAAEVRGVLPSVLFCPDHLDMVKRGARKRREALDDFGVQLNAGYASILATYERAVEQRNNLLKERVLPAGLLEAWDDAHVRGAAAVLSHRLALLARLRERLIEVYAQIAPRETVDVCYRSTAGEVDVTMDRVQLEDMVRQALAASREDEARRALTLVGPHRDEIAFTVDGRDARSFASQGQQRSLVLAWKIAEVRVTRDILGRYPLLLLDDVMSELDAARRDAIMHFVEGEIQTVITTTNLGYFNDDVLGRAQIVPVGEQAKE